MLTEGTILLKPLPYSSPSKFAILNELPFFAEITNLARLLKSMVSTTNVSENMEMQTYGNTLQIYSITSPSPPSSITKSSASTEVSPPALIPSITSKHSIVYKRFLTKVQCAISYGRTQMTDADGEYLLEERGIRLGRIFQKHSTIIMD